MLDSYDKHFLDSSVTQPMLFGSEVYREYFKKHFGDERLYISNYVQMEFLRSFVIPLLNFYFTLDLPNIRTISDALALWSNSFKTRELKAIIRLMSIIFRAHVLDFSDPKDKEKALTDKVNEKLELWGYEKTTREVIKSTLYRLRKGKK